MSEVQHDIDAQMQRHLEVFKKRPRLYVRTAATYQLVQNYIEGYLDGLSLPLECDYRYIISRWYAEKNKISGAFDIMDYVPEHFAGKSEKELRHMIVDIVKEYFRGNPISKYYQEDD